MSVVFADAVHPEYQSRPAHGWFPKDEKVAIKATSGRKRLNIHGAFDLETSRLTWVESERISAQTTLSLLQKLEAAYPKKRVIHVFLDKCPLSSCQDVATVVATTGLPDQTALSPALRAPFESDRAIMGHHA